MKYLSLFISAVLVLFAVAQYNDPDGLWWVVVYIIPAVWTVVIAFHPELARRGTVMSLLIFCLLAAVAATIYYWPSMPDWWQLQVWWEQETAREGMGVMIVLIAMLMAFLRGVIYSIHVRP